MFGGGNVTPTNRSRSPSQAPTTPTNTKSALKSGLLTVAGYGVSALTGGVVSASTATRGLTIVGDYAGQKMDENGIDMGDLAKKGAHKFTHLFKKKNKHKKSEAKKRDVQFNIEEDEKQEEIV